MSHNESFSISCYLGNVKKFVVAARSILIKICFLKRFIIIESVKEMLNSIEICKLFAMWNPCDFKFFDLWVYFYLKFFKKRRISLILIVFISFANRNIINHQLIFFNLFRMSQLLAFSFFFNRLIIASCSF